MDEEHRWKAWCAVYGAMVAAQVHELRQLRGETPTDAQMVGYVEEAVAVADDATKALVAHIR